MERALPSAPLKDRVAALAVGLASDCDAPEEVVDGLMREHLAGASTLPFVGLLTPDGEWITGWSGHRDVAQILEALKTAEESPKRDATPAVRKQLEKVAAAASGAAAKGDWKQVLAAAKKAAETTGRCPERDAIRAADEAARVWVAAQWAAIDQDARSGADPAGARKRLAEIKRHFAGEPEAADADTGTKALLRLTRIRKAEAGGGPSPSARERAAEEFAGTRWAAIFAIAAAAEPTPQDEPK